MGAVRVKDEETEVYTVAEIRAAFFMFAGIDSWGVPCLYEDGLIAALRGEYDAAD